MRLTERVHANLRKALQPGDTAVDATAGNGHDTLFLARQVGTEGRVYAFDSQAIALETTRQRLITSEAFLQCQLQQLDHAVGLARLLRDIRRAVAAVVFNLGYLPGADKALTTSTETTLPALDAAALLLRPGGLLCVTAYRGHPGGLEEAAAVEAWMRDKAAQGWPLETHQSPGPVLWCAHPG